MLKIIIITFFLYVRTEAQLCDSLSSNQDNISKQCKAQLEAVCSDVSTMWKMFDASSKYPPTGLLYSDGKDLGNFDECLSIKLNSPQEEIRGKYCGLGVKVDTIVSNKNFDKIIQIPAEENNFGLNYGAKSSQTTISALLSVCIPEACNTTEVGHYFIEGLLNKTIDGISPVITFKNSRCMRVDSNTDFEMKSITYIIALSIHLLAIILSTSYELTMDYLEQEPRNKLLIAFSLYSNGKRLFKVKHSKNSKEITCLNGLKTISMLWIMAGHNFVTYQYLPTINYLEIQEWTTHIWVMYAAAAPIAVDTFFFIGALLLSITFLKIGEKLSTKQQIKQIPRLILHRYIRITPAIINVYAGVVSIFPMLSSGPLWDSKIQPVKDTCDRYWWSFFLYIQNYSNYKDMCLVHTWYLSADMQLFIMAPLVLIPTSYYLKKNHTKIVLGSLFAFTALWVVIPIVHRLFIDKTYSNSYDTHSRINVYLAGIMLGVIFCQYQNRPYYFSKAVNLVLWVMVFIGSLGFLAYYHQIRTHYEHTSNVLFYGLSRPLWSAILSFMVYSCHYGYGGPVNWFLSLPICKIGARLSYCMYLLHAVIELYWSGIVRTQIYWGDYQIFYTWCGHLIVTVILATMWTFAFELPNANIQKFLIARKLKKLAKKRNGPKV